MRTSRALLSWGVVLTLGLGLAGAQDKGKAKGKGPNIPPPIKLTIAGFNDGQEIPQKYTCAVPNAVSPAMQWTDVPAGTASFAIIFHDPDPVLNKGTGDVLHWAIFNIPGTARSLPEGVANDPELTDGARQPNNLGGKPGYMGPCPPPPSEHHYTFEFYALDTKLDLPAGSSRDELLKAMNGHVLAKAVYIGMFHR